MYNTIVTTPLIIMECWHFSFMCSIVFFPATDVVLIIFTEKHGNRFPLMFPRDMTSLPVTSQSQADQ